MSNNGVSKELKIEQTKFQENFSGAITRYKLESASPPVNSSQNGHASQAITKWINPYPDIAFQKIITPLYQGVSKYTTQISNQPDYIKDYHFIALMRCIDFYNQPTYRGYIRAEGESVKPSGIS